MSSKRCIVRCWTGGARVCLTTAGAWQALLSPPLIAIADDSCAAWQKIIACLRLVLGMNTSLSSKRVLSLYRGLLRAVRYYPSKKRDSLVQAIKQDFREKRNMSGEQLEKALWLGQMELQRLQKWVPTSKQMADGKDMDIKL